MNDAPTCPECGGRDDWHKAGCSYTGATPPPAQSSGAEPAATETEPLGAQTSGPTTPPAKNAALLLPDSVAASALASPSSS